MTTRDRDHIDLTTMAGITRPLPRRRRISWGRVIDAVVTVLLVIGFLLIGFELINIATTGGM